MNHQHRRVYLEYSIGQIETYLNVIESGGVDIPYTRIECLLCEDYDFKKWFQIAKDYKYRGMHCNKCTDFIHRAVGVTWNCCDNYYHPLFWKLPAPLVILVDSDSDSELTWASAS